MTCCVLKFLVMGSCKGLPLALEVVGIKDCYQDFGSFPEDHQIPAAVLIDMWAELYELDEDDAIINLNKLSDRNLINLVLVWYAASRKDDQSEVDDCYNDLKKLYMRGC
ncbi:hypothetical protein F3Y22_tig00112343pilonHSYRG00104 [Hibiscus syriacus]|uniref:Uncharacterized protein n=1 Tax=Hibiscus syriacus TaxID=106335 RepID=A0A6A2Y9F0_HIBSY|nr:hypothetical protein F3Y22_tig00112343pilonHSYRG00104 [Hibiscus syriacus]